MNIPKRGKDSLSERRQVTQIRVGLQKCQDAGVGRRVSKSCYRSCRRSNIRHYQTRYNNTFSDM